MSGYSKIFPLLLTGFILFSCSNRLDKLDADARVYVETLVTEITSDWESGKLMRSVYPGVKKKFDLEKVDEVFFQYKRLGALKDIIEINGQAAISTNSNKEEISSGMYLVKAVYENGSASVYIYCILDHEKWYTTGFQVNSTFFNNSEILEVPQDKDHEKPISDKATLETEVADLLDNSDTISIRNKIEKLYALAKIYEVEGADGKLIRLLGKILEADAGNLRYQLKFARLLSKAGHRSEAMERALLVYGLTEDTKKLEQSKELLKALNVQIPLLPTGNLPQTGIEIMLVPMGDINMQVIYELRVLLQEKMGIRISIFDRAIELGPPDRMGSEPYLLHYYKEIKKLLSQAQHQAILDELDIQNDISASPADQNRYIWKYFSHLGKGGQNYREAFFQGLKLQENAAQYFASTLIERLRFGVPFGENTNIKGYLGVTSKGLYCPTCNFLYGSADNAYGVISYDKYLADQNNEKENRQRLVRRLLKQALSSSNFLLGIPRCNIPYCARAYPHSLKEHDAKSDDLCPVCLSRLDELKRGSIFNSCATSLYLQGKDYAAKGKNDKAIWSYSRALEEDPEFAEAYGALGSVYFTTNELDKALTAYQKANKLSPEDDVFLFNVGITYYKKKEYEPALDHFFLLLEKNGNNADALRSIGECYSQMKNLEKAIFYLEKAISIDPEDSGQFVYLGACFSQAGEPDKAISVFEKMIQIFPNDYNGYYNLARLFMNKSNPKAIENFKQTIALNPKLIPAYRMLGICLARSGKLDEAIAIYKQGISIEPNHDLLFNDLGYTYYTKKEYFQAIKEYERALKINQNNGLCHYNKALAHYSLGQFPSARLHFETSRDLGYTGSPKFRQAIYQAMGEDG